MKNKLIIYILLISSYIAAQDVMFNVLASSGPGAPITLRTDLEGIWELQETSGSTAADSSGNAYDGTITGATVGGTGFGNFTYAYEFDGSGDYVDMGSFMDITLSNNWSLSLWYKTNDLVNTKFIGGWQKAAGGRYVFCAAFYGASAGDPLQVYVQNTTGQVSGVKNESNTNWHHLVMTWDGTTVKYYLDDSVMDTDDGLSGTLINPDNGFVIGRDKGSTARDFNGSLVQVAWWSRTITSSEVSTINNSTDGYLHANWP